LPYSFSETPDSPQFDRLTNNATPTNPDTQGKSTVQKIHGSHVRLLEKWAKLRGLHAEVIPELEAVHALGEAGEVFDGGVEGASRFNRYAHTRIAPIAPDEGEAANPTPG